MTTAFRCCFPNCEYEAVVQDAGSRRVFCRQCWARLLQACEDAAPSATTAAKPKEKATGKKISLNDLSDVIDISDMEDDLQDDRQDKGGEVPRPKCIATSCRIMMADGTYKALSEVRTADMVFSYDLMTKTPVTATVQWIDVTNKHAATLRFGDLLVTPGHPIFYRGEMRNCVKNYGWQRGPVTSVCNLLLDYGHCVLVEANWLNPVHNVRSVGMWCSTLGDPNAYDAECQPLHQEWKQILVYNNNVTSCLGNNNNNAPVHVNNTNNNNTNNNNNKTSIMPPLPFGRLHEFADVATRK